MITIIWILSSVCLAVIVCGCCLYVYGVCRRCTHRAESNSNSRLQMDGISQQLVQQPGPVYDEARTLDHHPFVPRMSTYSAPEEAETTLTDNPPLYSPLNHEGGMASYMLSSDPPTEPNWYWSTSEESLGSAPQQQSESSQYYMWILYHFLPHQPASSAISCKVYYKCVSVTPSLVIPLLFYSVSPIQGCCTHCWSDKDQYVQDVIWTI